MIRDKRYKHDVGISIRDAVRFPNQSPLGRSLPSRNVKIGEAADLNSKRREKGGCGLGEARANGKNIGRRRRKRK